MTKHFAEEEGSCVLGEFISLGELVKRENMAVRKTHEEYIQDFLDLDNELACTCATKKEYVEKASALHLKYFGLQGNSIAFIEGIYMSMWDYKKV